LPGFTFMRPRVPYTTASFARRAEHTRPLGRARDRLRAVQPRETLVQVEGVSLAVREWAGED